MSIHDHLKIGLLEQLNRKGVVHIQHYKRQLSLFEGDYFGYFPGTGEIPDSLQIIGMATNYSFPKTLVTNLRFDNIVELYFTLLVF